MAGANSDRYGSDRDYVMTSPFGVYLICPGDIYYFGEYCLKVG